MTEVIQPIPARLKNVAVGGHVAGAEDIIDDALQKDQATINQEVQEAIGTGGSVDSRISTAINALDASVSKSAGADGLSLSVIEENGKVTAINGSIASNTYDAYGSASAAQSAAISAAATDATTKVNAAKAEIKGSATSACDTLGEAEALISAEKTRAQGVEATKADKATTLAGYGITDTYTKTEVNGLVSTPHQNYVTVQTYSALPASGSADTIYRVSNYDGSTSQVDVTKYSEYAWNGSQYIFLCVKSQIDEVFDITVYNSNTKYANLTAALAAVPQDLQRGGMSIKYVQTSDNKYVQYRLMSDSFNTTPANWQGVDEELVVFSKNLLESGGAFAKYGEIVGDKQTISLKNAISHNHNWEKVSGKNDFYLYPETTCDALTFPIYLNNISQIEVVKSDGTPQNTVFKVVYDNDSGVGNPRDISSLIKFRAGNYNIVKVYMYWVNTQGNASYCDNPENLSIVLYRKKREINIGIRNMNTLNIQYSNQDSENAVTTLTYNNGSSLYFSDNFGINYTFTLSANTFQIPHLYKLIHNLRTNVTEVKAFSYICTEYEVVLTHCYSGYLFGGVLALSNYYLNRGDVRNLKNEMTFISSLTEFEWEQGLWDTNGQLQDRTTRIRFPYMVAGNTVSVQTISTGYVFVSWYDANKQHIGFADRASVGQLTNPSAKYARIGFGIDDATNITPAILGTIDLTIFAPNYSPVSVYQEHLSEIDDKIYDIENISKLDKYVHIKDIPYCVVNDKFSETSGSAGHLQIDEATGICFVEFLTSHTDYGETRGLSGLSVFPASQPFKAENYIFAKTGDLDFNGNPIDGQPYETNCLVYRDGNNKLKCRCFFNCANQKLYYRDFDYETRTFDFAAKIVQYNGADMTRDVMSQIVQDAGYDAWGTGNGIIFTSNLYKNYTDGYIYACIEGTTGNPIVIKSNDNFASCVFVGILPEKVWYECQICELNGTFYIMYRQPNITMQTTTDFENFSTKVTLSTCDQRPQCISYNNNVWLFVPSKVSYSGKRQCYEIYKGTGTDLTAYTKVATLENEFGVVYISGCFLNGRLAISFSTSPFMFTATEGKDDVAYYVLPNVYEGTKPISIY